MIATSGCGRNLGVESVRVTESVRTQMFLRDLLESKGYRGRIVLLNGSNGDPESRARYQAWVRRHQGTATVSG